MPWTRFFLCFLQLVSNLTIESWKKCDAEGDFGQNLKANMETLQNPKHEQDLVHRLFDKFGKTLTKDWKAMEKMEKRGWKRKKAKKLSNKKAKKARAKAKKLSNRKAKKTRAKDGAEESEDEDKDSEDGWSQGKLPRHIKQYQKELNGRLKKLNLHMKSTKHAWKV